MTHLNRIITCNRPTPRTNKCRQLPVSKNKYQPTSNTDETSKFRSDLSVNTPRHSHACKLTTASICCACNIQSTLNNAHVILPLGRPGPLVSIMDIIFNFRKLKYNSRSCLSGKSHQNLSLVSSHPTLVFVSPRHAS